MPHFSSDPILTAQAMDLDKFLQHAAEGGPCVGVHVAAQYPLVAPRAVEVRTVDGSQMQTVDALYDVFAKAWDFPAWFGRNADAFDDFMRDLDNMVSAGPGRLPARGYLTDILNAHLILVEQPDAFSWFANCIPFYRDYYRDELDPPATFALLLCAPADFLDEVRRRWGTVGVHVAVIDLVSGVLAVIPPEQRALITEELRRRNPKLLAQLSDASEPTNDQSNAVVEALSDALSANYGPSHMPNEYGLAVERAINSYLEAWPIYR